MQQRGKVIHPLNLSWISGVPRELPLIARTAFSRFRGRCYRSFHPAGRSKTTQKTNDDFIRVT
jgi:hypothetical protein